jgi:hypothetical protein
MAFSYSLFGTIIHQQGRHAQMTTWLTQPKTKLPLYKSTKYSNISRRSWSFVPASRASSSKQKEMTSFATAGVGRPTPFFRVLLSTSRGHCCSIKEAFNKNIGAITCPCFHEVFKPLNIEAPEEHVLPLVKV